MSKEYKPPSLPIRVVRLLAGEVWGLGSSVLVLTVSGLLVTHLVRKMDKGLIHWPLHPELPIRLGG